MATVSLEPSIEPAMLAPSSTLAEIVREGLMRTPKQLPPWLFYDEAGSLLFEQITCLPEYYLTRLERAILTEHAGSMVAAAARDHETEIYGVEPSQPSGKRPANRLRLIELGAGSADKTRTLLAATLAQQGSVTYQPVDVSESALEAARIRIHAELPGVTTIPVVADYTAEWDVDSGSEDAGSENERKLLLWIGSSIGNFEPVAAEELLTRINQSFQSGDSLLLGVDLAPCAGGKCVGELLAAYDDEAQVTAEFNRNLLVRLNRDLATNFDPEAFAHSAVWNESASRMEMHLESLRDQQVNLAEIDLKVHFAAGERLHTENSYKYTTGRAESLMARAGFPVIEQWQDPDGWFAVLLGRKP